jgi:hypothetical protein
MSEAAKWFQYLGEKYPGKPIIDGDPTSFPRNITLDQYAVAVVQGDINETSQDRVTSAVQGLLVRSYYELVLGQDDRFNGFQALARKVYGRFETDISDLKSNQQRIGLPPFADLNRAVLDGLLDPQQGLPYAARAIIRSQLGMPAETNAPPEIVATNAPVATGPAPTNAPAARPAGK